MEFGGEIISPADFETDVYRMRSIWQVGEGVYLALREDDPEPSLDENLNHSCDANSWLADEVTLAARRDIEADEEITLDQGTWNFEEDDYVWDQDHCTCGADDCRKIPHTGRLETAQTCGAIQGPLSSLSPAKPSTLPAS